MVAVEDKKAAMDIISNPPLSKSETQQDGQQFEAPMGHETKRGIKTRQAQMIAIGGSIGTGLFVGSGQALSVAGPGFLLAAYSLMSLFVYGIVTAVIEVGSFLPVSGSSMSFYCKRFTSPSLEFALGWLYCYSFGVIVAYETTAASIVINYWPNNVHIAVWITIMMVVIIGLNLCPVGVYAETEFYFAGLKVIMIIGMLILSAVIMAGGGPNHEALGFKYWNDPGATKTLLVDGAGNANASPWVIAVRNVGIDYLPSIINAGILTSAWSAGNAYLYMSSRSLYSLAKAGNAPQIFTRCNRHGLPIYAVLATSCFSFLAYLNCGPQAGTVFNWFINLTNSAGFLSWMVCSITFIRFHQKKFLH